MNGDIAAPDLQAGIYEKLITTRLEARITQLEAGGWHVVRDTVGAESTPHVLAAHIGAAVRDLLQSSPAEKRVRMVNQILDALSSLEDAKQWIEQVADGPRQLHALFEPTAPGVYALNRPSIPLSESALLTNAPDDPSLGSELRAELATADRVDLLCAFVKWTGLRVLEQRLKQSRERGVALRVITTTYLGATEQGALDRLVRDFGAEVKVNYELRSTRLHAKAWLFRRRSGYDTAYVGSSNLSRAALLDGLEWNVRLSSVATPAALRKFEATFDAYWSEPAFETYDPDDEVQRQRLAEALRKARSGPSASADGSRVISLSGLEVRPYPHQRDMLERLETERKVRDRHRNLLVAATGTGKTVMAALDYRNLCTEHGRRLRLLFVAHRREILDQSLRTYREVLQDADFGEQHVGGAVPVHGTHVFASVQSLNSQPLDRYERDRFEVVVIDEFHHGTAATYRRVVDHFQPRELLGLTATPERMDGRSIQDEFFDGRIAAEMRLWEALENDLLSPFHYFGVSDTADLRSVAWSRGSYDETALSNVLTGDTARALLVVRAVKDKISDPAGMRALGFCVSVAHAEFMAGYFRSAGFAAVALSGSTPETERRHALHALKQGDIQVVFSVDLLNEGLDIPNVDTLLLLRPTQSATVFLQQLGRGLRRTEDKAVLTVLDFIGMHCKEFRFENQFRALTNLTRRRLRESIEQDFPQLPSGCQIVLEPKAKERVLENIRSQLGVNARQLAQEIAAYAEPALADYLRESGRDIKEIYRAGRSWTGLLRKAGILREPAPDTEGALLKRMPALLHVDDRDRADLYALLLSDAAPSYDDLSPEDRRRARMLFFTLWPTGGGFASYQEGFDTVSPLTAFRSEARQVLAHAIGDADHLPIPLLGDLGGIPLRIHCSYSREEILAALGEAHLNGGLLPGNFQEGVRWCEGISADALLITLEKDEKDFSPQTRYHDYALNESLFHWESQNRTAETSATGKRYRTHAASGTHVLPFVRRYKKTDIGGPQPWMFLGPATYTGHTGSRPMAITWHLKHQLPADVWSYSAIAAG
ncbi:DUF3427 domain-containing protein [Streptomyces sp. NPDC051940]|uniref:DUF3427 domain-containing protein n=1 Tax=Streptomyces sp. NPDC051940 TaxID=3155675 RepID=UPI00342C41E1